MNYRIFWLLLLLAFTSCEKDIDFDLLEAEPLPVIDGRIEQGEYPVVVLTKSLNYFNVLDLSLLAGSFIRNAEVSIMTDSIEVRLKEFEQPLLPGISFYYYSVDTTGGAPLMKGEYRKTYRLNIRLGDKRYESVTTIPALNIVPDSVWFEKAPLNPDTLKRIMMVRISDPPGIGNYFRYKTKVNQEPFYPFENSVFSDEVTDGKIITGRFPRGFDPNQPPNMDENYFIQGDTVTLQVSNIDKATYTFWNTWEFSRQSIGNPFSQPNKVIGNVSGGALGAFCGYAHWYRTFVVR